ncbi:hypothetical protein Ddc_14719 [Ditylenchus destructor]|nr:hypothetical protein Ddc_14719 [Ditylenchus destructor]
MHCGAFAGWPYPLRTHRMAMTAHRPGGATRTELCLQAWVKGNRFVTLSAHAAHCSILFPCLWGEEDFFEDFAFAIFKQILGPRNWVTNFSEMRHFMES